MIRPEETMAHFSPDLFGFLLELRANNQRDWFKAQRSRYEASIKDPMLAFITDFGPPLRTISSAFVADPRPSGGSMFRIYRDTRFGKDKSPYKTHAAAHFRHVRAKDVHAPGFYLHLEPGSVFVAAGMWRPDGRSLKLIRDRIVEKPAVWTAARDALAAEGIAIEGESLKRPPRGFDAAHPLLSDLKRKSFVASVQLSEAEACADSFVDTATESYRKVAPLVEFLTTAVGLEY